jgi:hypothetical protein
VFRVAADEPAVIDRRVVAELDRIEPVIIASLDEVDRSEAERRWAYEQLGYRVLYTALRGDGIDALRDEPVIAPARSSGRRASERAACSTRRAGLDRRRSARRSTRADTTRVAEFHRLSFGGWSPTAWIREPRRSRSEGRSTRFPEMRLFRRVPLPGLLVRSRARGARCGPRPIAAPFTPIATTAT